MMTMNLLGAWQNLVGEPKDPPQQEPTTALQLGGGLCLFNGL